MTDSNLPQHEFRVTLDTMFGRRAVENAALLAHEANRGYCYAYGDGSQMAWALAEEWQRSSAKQGVEQIVKNPATTPAESHANWLDVKVKDGWVYGAVKDPEKKTHPCMVGYDELPPMQRHKDAIFGAVVREALYCYGERTMTNKAVKIPELSLPYGAVETDKTYGLVQTQGRALRISGMALLAYLEATGYPIPGEELLSQVHHHVLLCSCAPTPAIAYDWYRANHFAQILIDFPQMEDVELARPTHPSSSRNMERLRVQWHLIFYITRAVHEIEGVSFKSQDVLRSMSKWYVATGNAARQDAEGAIVDAIARASATDIIAAGDAEFVGVIGK